VVVPALREELMLLMPPDHPLAAKRRVLPKDLALEPFVLFEPLSNTRRTIDRLFTQVGIEPRVVLETENVEILKALVASGMGLSIIPFQSVDDEVRAGKLACARISGHVLERETGWVYPRSSHMPRALQELMRTLETIRGTLKLAPDGAPKAVSPA
jgi:DNA-binding transcriptional LysR family regulator